MPAIHKTSLSETAADRERTEREEVLRALRDVRFGTIQLVIHDGRLVEIQKTERIRPASCCRPQ